MQHIYEIWEHINYDRFQNPEDHLYGRDPGKTWMDAVRENAYRGENARVRINRDQSILLINDLDDSYEAPREQDREEFLWDSIPAQQWLDDEKKKEEEDDE